jgi:hypothetical protein
VYEPLEWIAKLAALIPRPRKNLVFYHGVLSANAAWRSQVVAYGATRPPTAQRTLAGSLKTKCTSLHCRITSHGSGRISCGDAFGHDLLACARCGGKMELLEIVLERTAIRRVLSHLRLPTDPPATAPARASPEFGTPLDRSA